jgi:hypothetical protein
LAFGSGIHRNGPHVGDVLLWHGALVTVLVEGINPSGIVNAVVLGGA